jgi:hypothetical protein
MPSTSEALRPASAMAFLIASTAMARVLRFDRLLYSVSPTPTMQYLSLSPAILPPREKKVRDAAAAVPAEQSQRHHVEGRAAHPGRPVTAGAIINEAGPQRAEGCQGARGGEEKADQPAGMLPAEEIGDGRA